MPRLPFTRSRSVAPIAPAADPVESPPAPREPGELERIRQRIEELQEKRARAEQARDTAAAEIGRRRAERTQLALADTDPAAIGEASRRIRDLEDARETADGVVSALAQEMAALEQEHHAITARRAMDRLITEHASAVAGAIAARDAMLAAVRRFVGEELPQLVARYTEGNARIAAVVSEAQATARAYGVAVPPMINPRQAERIDHLGEALLLDTLAQHREMAATLLRRTATAALPPAA